MTTRSELDIEVAAFLGGDPAVHRAVREAVGIVVRSFRFDGSASPDDLVQEAVCRVYLNLSVGAFRGEASLRAYAQRVTRYVCLEAMRRRRFTAALDPAALTAPASAGNPEESLLRDESRRRHIATLRALPAEARQLLGLIFIEELSYSEVAERLGISEAAVKLRVHRYRLTMREGHGGEGTAGGRLLRPGWRWLGRADK